MDSSKLAIKLFIEHSADLTHDVLVPIFHRWIQTRALPGHQLIDVADYKHVQDGPGTLLVAFEANLYADLSGGRLGLLYIRKAPLPGSFKERLRAVLGYELKAAQLLEADPSLAGRVKFRTDEITFQINDRLLAPNTPETFAQIKGDLESVLADVCGTAPQLTYKPDSQRLFEVDIRPSHSVPLATLIDRLG